MKIMTGIDLHGNNAVLGLMDMEGRKILHKRVPCELPKVLDVLEPYREQIDTIAVESTFNWYWLVDGLQENHYKVVLANPAKIDQYDGLKHPDDKSEPISWPNCFVWKFCPLDTSTTKKLGPCEIYCVGG